jgi:AAA family ATP:ADP antiporter
LIQKLADSNHRSAAIEALASYGSAILGSLRDCLLDRSVALIIRQSIPRVIGRMDDQQAVDTLCRVLNQVETGLRFSVVRALSKLRARFERLRFSRPVVMTSLLEETRDYYRCHQILHRTRSRQPTSPDQLLEKTLQEKLDRNLERIFRLLGLCYPPGDMYSAYQGITHTSTSQRASAMEFLDNLLRANEKKYLFPILDDLPLAATIRHGRELFGLAIGSRVDALGQLISGDDSWLKACAIYASSSEGSPELRRSIEKVQDDSDPIVQETCRLVLGRQG